MKIDSHPMVLSKILAMDDSVRFYIPDYQRNYSWKPEHIDQLFNDIMNEEKGYYIGNLLVTPHEDEQGSIVDDVYDVIDGQQRLTTLSLFLLAIWEQAKKWFDNDNTPRSDIRNLDKPRVDIPRRLLVDQESDTPRLQLLETDATIYAQLLQVLDDSNTHPDKAPRNRSFTKRYEYIRKLFQDDENGNFPTANALTDFYDKLINVKLLRIEVGNLSDAFAVFSSLNSTGLPLTLVDLLKGRFIESAQRIAQESKTSILEKWNDFTTIFTPNNNDTDINAATQFLRNNYDAFENESTSSTTNSKALKQYRDIIQQKYRSNVDYLQELINHARTFAQLLQIQSYPEDSINQRLNSLRRLESTQAYPLMLFLLTQPASLELDDRHITHILDALISFYVRRNISLVPKSSNIRSRMLKLVQDIRKSALRGDELVDRVIRELKDLSVSDEQFATAITSDGMYDKNAKTTRFVLIEVERYLNRTTGISMFDKGRPDNLDGYKPNSSIPLWSIEHILPEGPLTDYWRDMISPDTPNNAEDILEQYRHLIGNLTLTPYNSNLGQRPFVDETHPYAGEQRYQLSKRDYADNGHFVGLRQKGLAINISIADIEHGETIETKTSWTPADIQRRTEWFKDQILTVFKFPTPLDD